MNMKQESFDWIGYLSDTLKIGLPWAALLLIVIAILWKLNEKLIDQKLEKQTKKYEKTLDILTNLKENALDNCRNIIKVSPRIRNLINSIEFNHYQNPTAIIEQIQIMEDEIRSLRILVSDKEKNFIKIHTWKSDVLFFTSKLDILDENEFKIHKSRLLTNYDEYMSALKQIVRQIID